MDANPRPTLGDIPFLFPGFSPRERVLVRLLAEATNLCDFRFCRRRLDFYPLCPKIVSLIRKSVSLTRRRLPLLLHPEREYHRRTELMTDCTQSKKVFLFSLSLNVTYGKSSLSNRDGLQARDISVQSDSTLTPIATSIHADGNRAEIL